MALWRSVGSVVILLAAAGTGAAQTYSLSEAPEAGDCFRVQLQMKLSGEMRINRDGKTVPLKLAAAAAHEFRERILIVGKNGLPQKSARIYESAKAEITVADNRSERTLRPERKLMVAQWHKDQFLCYSPAGSLTREELELVGEHFDTLSVTGLLPAKDVAVGATWKVSNAAVQGLCGFDGLVAQDLVCKLEEVEANVARISIKGTASGIATGALAKLAITATARYNVTQKRLTAVEWQQKDERDQGPASPATSVETTIIMKRTAIEEPTDLGDVALVSVPSGAESPPASFTQVYYCDPKQRFDLAHGREWHLVGHTGEHTILRLMNNGEFIAQVTITPWHPAKPGEHMSAKEFEEAMADTPGWEQEQVLQSEEVPAEKGRWVYRVSALGTLDDLKVMQNFYLIAGPGGEQMVVAFTLKPALAERLGTRDLSLVGSLELLPSK